jgi:small subunit ribosomal protein S20
MVKSISLNLKKEFVMAVHASTIKRERQNKARRIRNQAVLSRLKTVLKKARTALEAKDPHKAQQAMDLAISALDKAATKGVIHKNKASRTISRLSRRYHQLMPTETSGQEPGSTAQPAT